MGRRIVIAAAVLSGAFCCVPTHAARREHEVLARVNGEDVTRADLDLFLAASPARGELDPDLMSADVRRELELQRRRQAFAALLDNRLLLQEAVKAYLAAEDADEAMERIGREELERLRQQAGSTARASRLLESMGLTSADYVRVQAERILVASFVRDKVYAVVHVSPAEMRRFYDARREEFAVPTRLTYRQILLPVLEPDDEATQRKQAEGLLEQLQGGADFAELANTYSADREKYPGGLHKVTVPEDEPDWRPPAVVGLKEGELSGVRTLAGCLAIVRLEKVEPPIILSFDEVQGRIKDFLLAEARQGALARYVERLRSTARIEYLPAADELRS